MVLLSRFSTDTRGVYDVKWGFASTPSSSINRPAIRLAQGRRYRLLGSPVAWYKAGEGGRLRDYTHGGLSRSSVSETVGVRDGEGSVAGSVPVSPAPFRAPRDVDPMMSPRGERWS